VEGRVSKGKGRKAGKGRGSGTPHFLGESYAPASGTSGGRNVRGKAIPGLHGNGP